MRKKALFFPVLAALMLAGCSKDDVSEVIPDETPKVFTGDEAYMSVKLADVGSITSRGSDGGFQYGNDDEHSVSTAHFYFYDEDGLFVAEGSAWNGGEDVSSTPVGNIEFKSKTIVVLKGLTKKNYPKYMVTVLNKPGDFTPGQTLDEMEKTLSDENGEGIWNTVNNENFFTMSTTSYKHSDNSPYFVTEVEEENFSLEPIDADNIQSPVTVYVERLAAKVTVNVSDELEADENGRYKITTTVAGNGNVGTDGNPAAEELYVELLGWKLNATAKHSNMMKNIDSDWNERFGSETDGFAWNDANNFRSYWGKSYNYGLVVTANGTYPDNFSTINATDFLNYVDLNNPVGLGNFSYCAENTNTSEIVSVNFPSAVTSVLLSAKVCDKSGKGLDLVRYNGTLFTKEAFLNYILNVLNTNGKLNYWTTTDNQNYTQIDSEFVEWDNVSDGVIKVVFKRPSDETIYKKEDNSYSKVTDFTELNKDLEKAATDAIGYNGGLMYYNIPIEHLNNDEISETDGNKTIPEAKYGVVRNHHYVVTINKLENMGHGIFDSNEAIVPGDDDKETYYVGANINILSWKIVSQNVEL
ncbi:MAG: Mfa1 family fimbria major subunit [Bacteroides thetaiotaomicron]|uniref:Mfa1 family fimbria major subunit n=1 Tax=Alistipes sp. TaxID=1872444 RepID=UPI0039918FDA